MSSWDDMRNAKEGSYFEKKNREAIERLKKKEAEEKPRLSPITGKPMEQVALGSVVIDRCPDCGGIWLDAGELEELIEAAKQTSAEEENVNSGIGGFLKGLAGLK